MLNLQFDLETVDETADEEPPRGNATANSVIIIITIIIIIIIIIIKKCIYTCIRFIFSCHMIFSSETIKNSLGRLPRLF